MIYVRYFSFVIFGICTCILCICYYKFNEMVLGSLLIPLLTMGAGFLIDMGNRKLAAAEQKKLMEEERKRQEEEAANVKPARTPITHKWQMAGTNNPITNTKGEAEAVVPGVAAATTMAANAPEPVAAQQSQFNVGTQPNTPKPIPKEPTKIGVTRGERQWEYDRAAEKKAAEEAWEAGRPAREAEEHRQRYRNDPAYARQHDTAMARQTQQVGRGISKPKFCKHKKIPTPKISKQLPTRKGVAEVQRDYLRSRLATVKNLRPNVKFQRSVYKQMIHRNTFG